MSETPSINPARLEAACKAAAVVDGCVYPRDYTHAKDYFRRKIGAAIEAYLQAAPSEPQEDDVALVAAVKEAASDEAAAAPPTADDYARGQVDGWNSAMKRIR